MEKILKSMEAVSSLIRILPTKEDKCSTCASTAIKHFHLIVNDYSLIDPYSSLPELSDAKCSYCQKSNGDLKYCNGCKNLIFYCDKICQMKHWIIHSKTCNSTNTQDTVDFSNLINDTKYITNNLDTLKNSIKISINDLKINNNSNNDPEKIVLPKMNMSDNSFSRKKKIDAIFLSKSSSFLTTLSHGKDPFDFYIQAVKYISKAEQLTTELNKICKPQSSLPLTSLEPGDFCAAKYTDGKWYRAQILEFDELVHIFFVDYGNDEYIDCSNLYPLPETFYQLPALAIHCKLSNIKPIDDNITWPQDAIEKFIYLHDSGYKILKVIKPGVINFIDLINNNKESLCERMCLEGFAMRIINKIHNQNNDQIPSVRPTKFNETKKKISVPPSEISNPQQNDLVIERHDINKDCTSPIFPNSDTNSSFSLISQLTKKSLNLSSYLDFIQIGSQITFIVHEVVNERFALAILNLEKFMKLSDSIKLEVSNSKYETLPIPNEIFAFLMPDENWYRGLLLPNNKAFLIDSGNIEQWTKCSTLSSESRMEVALAALVSGESVRKYFRKISLPISITNAKVIENGPSFLKVEAVTGTKKHHLKLFGWQETLNRLRNIMYTNADNTSDKIMEKENQSIESQKTKQDDEKTKQYDEKTNKNSDPLKLNLSSTTNDSCTDLQSNENPKIKSSLDIDYISSIPKDILTNGEHNVVPVYQDENDPTINYVLGKSDVLKTIVERMSDARNFPIAEPNIGDYVCAYSDDDDWYRARILSIKQNICTVYYIDFGNIDSVNKDNLRILPSDISPDKMPAQAIKCKCDSWEAIKEALNNALMIKIKVEGLNEDDEYTIKYLNQIK